MREIVLSGDGISARAEGINRLRDRVPVLTAIRVHYHLRIPPGTREAVEKALSRHVDKCPSAQTLKGCVEVSWTADIEELE